MAEPKHSAEQRAAALAAYREFGPAEASRRTGISVKTIASWARRSGVQMDAENQRVYLHKATVSARLSREERAARLAERLMGVAEQRVDLLETGGFRAREEHSLIQTVAIAVDKSQLLSGKATQRVETIAAEEAVAIENIVQLRRVA